MKDAGFPRLRRFPTSSLIILYGSVSTVNRFGKILFPSYLTVLPILFPVQIRRTRFSYVRIQKNRGGQTAVN